MKKGWMGTVLALLICLAFLAGCQRAESGPYTVEKDGVVYTIDMEQGTVSDGKETYQFTFFSKSNGYRLEIMYPDGSTYWWEQRANMGSGGWSEDYDETKYASGWDLQDVLTEGRKPAKEKNVVLILLLLIVGGLHTAKPDAMWYLQYGWRFQDAKPSEEALMVNRLGGVLALVVAVLLLLF